MDKEQKSKAEYNRTQMEEHIRRICHMARGTDASILPYINKADGTFSPKKAHDFIKDILCGADNLGTKEKGFLTAFFYCTFRCFASSRIRDYYAYEEFRPCATFQDILDKAKLVENDEYIDTKDKMYDLESRALEIDPLPESDHAYSFFVTMDLCYQLITDNKYTSLDEEGFKSYFERTDTAYQSYQSILDEMAEEAIRRDEEWKQEFAKEQGYESYEECEKALNEVGYENMYDYLDQHRFDDMSEEELEEYKKEQEESDELIEILEELDRRRKPAWDAYMRDFVDKEGFEKGYKQYRKLFFEVDHRSFYNKVERLVYNYMYEHGLCIFADDDATFEEFALLEDIEAKLNTSLARIRRKNGLHR